MTLISHFKIQILDYNPYNTSLHNYVYFDEWTISQYFSVSEIVNSHTLEILRQLISTYFSLNVMEHSFFPAVPTHLKLSIASFIHCLRDAKNFPLFCAATLVKLLIVNNKTIHRCLGLN